MDLHYISFQTSIASADINTSLALIFPLHLPWAIPALWSPQNAFCLVSSTSSFQDWDQMSPFGSLSLLSREAFFFPSSLSFAYCHMWIAHKMSHWNYLFHAPDLPYLGYKGKVHVLSIKIIILRSYPNDCYIVKS